MKVILYMAISVDGYVARTNHDTDWVSDTDWSVFSDMVKRSGCIVMGRKTYEVSGDDFPYNCKLNIVLTSQKKLHQANKNISITDKNPKDVIKFAKDKGFNKLLIIGGGKLNASFLKEKLN
jgi:dihydrofolate reductase